MKYLLIILAFILLSCQEETPTSNQKNNKTQGSYEYPPNINGVYVSEDPVFLELKYVEIKSVTDTVFVKIGKTLSTMYGQDTLLGSWEVNFDNKKEIDCTFDGDLHINYVYRKDIKESELMYYGRFYYKY